MTISSFDEWSPLKRIIVGDATHANWPVNDPVFSLESEKTLWKETPVPSGPVPDWIIDHANRDLDKLERRRTRLQRQLDKLKRGRGNFIKSINLGGF